MKQPKMATTKQPRQTQKNVITSDDISIEMKTKSETAYFRWKPTRQPHNNSSLLTNETSQKEIPLDTLKYLIGIRKLYTRHTTYLYLLLNDIISFGWKEDKSITVFWNLSRNKKKKGVAPRIIIRAERHLSAFDCCYNYNYYTTI